MLRCHQPKPLVSKSLYLQDALPSRTTRYANTGTYLEHQMKGKKIKAKTAPARVNIAMGRTYAMATCLIPKPPKCRSQSARAFWITCLIHHTRSQRIRIKQKKES